MVFGGRIGFKKCYGKPVKFEFSRISWFTSHSSCNMYINSIYIVKEFLTVFIFKPLIFGAVLRPDQQWTLKARAGRRLCLRARWLSDAEEEAMEKRGRWRRPDPLDLDRLFGRRCFSDFDFVVWDDCSIRPQSISVSFVE